MHEVVRMAQYGVTAQELERNMATLLKDVHQTAEQSDTMKSHEIIEDLIDDVDLGTTPNSKRPHNTHTTASSNHPFPF